MVTLKFDNLQVQLELFKYAANIHSLGLVTSRVS